MRRRDAIAGLGSLGILGAGGVLAARGVPSFDDDEDQQEDHEPVDLETLEATGSEAGTMTIPREGRVTVVDFFATWCDICEAQMPTFLEARDLIDDDVRFVWATSEAPSPSDEDRESIVAEWEERFVTWGEDDGRDWTLALDPRMDLSTRYDAHGQVPTTVAIDGDGEAHWKSEGEKSVEEIVEGVETALEAQ